MGDWTGSGSNRRAQGVCLPPKVKPSNQSRFTIPVGTLVGIKLVSDINAEWRQYRLKKELSFERFDRQYQGMYRFRQEGWFIRCGLQKIKQL